MPESNPGQNPSIASVVTCLFAEDLKGKKKKKRERERERERERKGELGKPF